MDGELDVARQAKRPKKANFSTSETMILISGVKTRYDLLKLNNTRVAEVCFKKRQAWKEITDNVNAVGGLQRSADSVKKRWSDLWSEARKIHLKRAQMTGKDPPDCNSFKYYDEVLEIIGERERKIRDGVEPVDSDSDNSFSVIVREDGCLLLDRAEADQTEFKDIIEHTTQATFLKTETPDPDLSETQTQVHGSCMLPVPSSSPKPLAGETVVQHPEAVPTTGQRSSRATSQTTCSQEKRIETESDDSDDDRADQLAARKRINSVTLSDNIDLNENYMKSCIEYKNAQTQLTLLQQKKIKLEIRLLQKQLDEDADCE